MNIQFPLLLLAGGKGQRANQTKGLISFGSKTWIEVQAQHFFALGGTHLYIGLGYQVEAYRPIILRLKSLAQTHEGHLIIVTNPKPEEGPFSTLWHLCQALSRSEPAWLAPIDLPLLSQPFWNHLEGVFYRELPSAVVPTFRGKGGHPVLLGPSVLTAIVQQVNLNGQRLDYFLQPFEPLRVEGDWPEILTNLNESAQWTHYRRAVMGGEEA